MLLKSYHAEPFSEKSFGSCRQSCREYAPITIGDLLNFICILLVFAALKIRNVSLPGTKTGLEFNN